MSDASLEELSSRFGGKAGFYKRSSTTKNCQMRFAVLTPPQASPRRACATLRSHFNG